MRLNNVKIGLHVEIVKLGDTEGILIKPKHLKVRKVGVTGVIMGHVPGHGGCIWWVMHDGSKDIGAYAFSEFKKI